MKKTRLTYRVPYADTDKMGVVYYANYLVYFERIRNEMLRDSGSSYTEMEKRGILLPVIEAHCVYRIPALYDDILEIFGWCEGMEGARITIGCEIVRNGDLLASGHTIHAFLSAETGKPIRIPQDVKNRLTSDGSHS